MSDVELNSYVDLVKKLAKESVFYQVSDTSDPKRVLCCDEDRFHCIDEDTQEETTVFYMDVLVRSNFWRPNNTDTITEHPLLKVVV